MERFVIPLTADAATDANVVGPKAANLAALGRAGLPNPGGFCLTAEAYRFQLAELGLEESAHRHVSAELSEARMLSVEIKLGLYEQPIAPEILDPLLAAWHAQMKVSEGLGVVRSSALIEDRAGANCDLTQCHRVA